MVNRRQSKKLRLKRVDRYFSIVIAAYVTFTILPKALTCFDLA